MTIDKKWKILSKYDIDILWSPELFSILCFCQNINRITKKWSEHISKFQQISKRKIFRNICTFFNLVCFCSKFYATLNPHHIYRFINDIAIDVCRIFLVLYYLQFTYMKYFFSTMNDDKLTWCVVRIHFLLMFWVVTSLNKLIYVKRNGPIQMDWFRLKRVHIICSIYIFFLYTFFTRFLCYFEYIL